MVRFPRYEVLPGLIPRWKNGSIPCNLLPSCSSCRRPAEHRSCFVLIPALHRSCCCSQFAAPSLSPSLQLLSGCVSSVEDHGYLVDIGVKVTKAFLPQQKAQEYIKNRNQGRPSSGAVSVTGTALHAPRNWKEVVNYPRNSEQCHLVKPSGVGVLYCIVLPTHQHSEVANLHATLIRTQSRTAQE